MYRRERVNERDVPESQHTIFVRGLPGTMTTDEIRTFFDKEGASGCSFDFVKVSPCRTKLYVAVRFDSKTIAREIMDKFSTDGQMMGYNVEMSWFRDIRRYLAHCAKQGIRPSRFREDIGGGGGGGSRRDFRGSRDNYRGGGRDRSKSPLRSPIRSRSHSRTRSQSNNSPTQRSRSYTRSPERGGQQTTDGGGGTDRSPSRSRSVHSRRTKSPADARSAHSRSRSKSSSVHSSPRSDKVKSSLLDYGEIKKERVVEASPSPPPRKSKRKKERKERKKRRYSSSPSMSPPPPAQNKHDAGSDMEASDGEIRTPPKKKQPQQQANGQPPAESPQSQQQQQQAAPTMTMTSNKQIGPFKPSAAEQQPPPFQPFAHRHLPVTAAQQQQQQQQLQANEAAMAAANSQHQQNQQAHQQNQPAHLQQQQMHSLQQHSQQPLPDSSSGAGGGGYVMQQPQSQQQQPQNQQQNKFRQTFKVDLGPPPNFPPSFKPIIDNVQQQQQPPPGIVYQTVNGGTKAKEDAKRPRVDEPSPPPPAVLRNPNKALSPMRESGPLAASVFKDIQRHILQEVRYKAQPEPEEESLGGLRLSALSKQRVTEEMREEKVANLSAELRERVNKKKRQLELSYRHDCETFGLVTRKLIEKDRSLEDRLKVALLETMKDLEGETMKQLDEFLDQLSYICA